MTEEIGVDGMTVELSHPGKVLFPDDGITKHDLAAYYADVAGQMLPWLRDRPITMARYPDGIKAQRIFQKNVPAYFPSWIRRVQVPRVEVKKDSATVEHAICERPATLVYLAGQACIEVHEFTSRADRVDRPDQLVIDFDPPDGQHFADVRRAALAARDLFDGELGLVSYVRTTGGRGLHVHVALNRRAAFKPVLEFGHAVAGLLARRHPDLITAEQRKDKRGSLVYADVMRNAYAQTVVATYGVRARQGAPVAMPLSWAEVADDGLDPGAFTIATTRSRLNRQGAGGGPWADFPGTRHGLGEAARRLARLSSQD
jgi:bifunctional non-homologous end joining protein LigD